MSRQRPHRRAPAPSTPRTTTHHTWSCCGTLYATRATILKHLWLIHHWRGVMATRRLPLLATTDRQEAHARAEGDVPDVVSTEEILATHLAARQRLMMSYVRAPCTCAAGQPDCPACIAWRQYHPYNPVDVPTLPVCNNNLT